MPRVEESTVRHIAGLARLSVDEAEAARFAHQLSTILDYVAQLNELDTRDVPPTAHPLLLSNVVREDEVRESWDVEKALASAPARQDTFFRVPKVLDQEGGA